MRLLALVAWCAIAGARADAQDALLRQRVLVVPREGEHAVRAEDRGAVAAGIARVAGAFTAGEAKAFGRKQGAVAALVDAADPVRSGAVAAAAAAFPMTYVRPGFNPERVRETSDVLPYFTSGGEGKAGAAKQKSMDIAVGYCNLRKGSKKRATVANNQFQWIPSLFVGKNLPQTYHLKRVFVYNKCCGVGGTQPLDGPLKELATHGEKHGFGLKMYCLHNIGNEAYAYMAHMALHHGDFADYVVFAHEHGPLNLASTLDDPIRDHWLHKNDCIWRWFLSLLFENDYVSIGFHADEGNYDEMLKKIEYVPTDGKCNAEHIGPRYKPRAGKECEIVVPPREPDGNGKCHSSHHGIYGGEFMAARELLMRRSNGWYAQLASCWAQEFVPPMLAGKKEGIMTMGSFLGGELESQWHSIAGPLLLPRENFVRGYWEGMDKVCAHLKFDNATGLATNTKEAYAAKHGAAN